MSSFANETAEDLFEQDEVDRAIDEHGISGADLEQMAGLEKDMENANVDAEYVRPANTSPKASTGAFLPPGAMPTTKTGALGTHANEFWFPECRNCPCCKGFKHGCKCRTGMVNACQDPNCTTIVEVVEEKPVEVKPRHKSVVTFKPKPATGDAPVATAPVVEAASPAVARVAPAAINTGANGVDTRAPCTYYASVRGCQYGAQCRFKHEGPGGGAGGGGGPSPTYMGGMPPNMMNPDGSLMAQGSPSGGICRFFAAGNCRSGAGCRFSHT